MNYKALYFLFLLLSSTLLWSQDEAANNLVVDGNKAHNQEEYIGAESQYRKAVSIAPNKTEALHNLGNTNYRIADYGSASQRFFQTRCEHLRCCFQDRSYDTCYFSKSP